MIQHIRQHDRDPMGWIIGGYRVFVMTIATGMMSVLWYYWGDMNNTIQKASDSFHLLAINVAGINEKLDNLDRTANKLDNNQKDILKLVNINIRDINILKTRMDYSIKK